MITRTHRILLAIMCSAALLCVLLLILSVVRPR